MKVVQRTTPSRVEEGPRILRKGRRVSASHMEAEIRRGVEFADALHLAAAHACTAMLTFDDRRFARRARALGAKPAVVVPA